MKGYTLVEMLLVLLLIAITVGFALPGLQSIYLKHKAATQINQFIRGLHFARNLSLIQHQSVLLCPIAENNKCGNNWQQGINIYLLTATAKELVRQISEFTDAKLSWNRKSNQIIFAANGLLSSQNGTFEYQLSDQKKQIVLSSTGRVRVIGK